MAVLRADNEKYQTQWKDQMMKEVLLKALIRYNRTQRAELKKSLVAYMADADAMTIDNYVKTELYNDVIGEICHQWYGFGFNLARKQAEAALARLRRLEISDSLDATYIVAIADDVPEEMPFPSEYLPERTTTGESPLVLLEKWEQFANDDIDAHRAFAPQPSDEMVDHTDCVVCQRKHALPACDAAPQS
ncbi:hypothetical protein Dimus_038237 [Dionaea muscipula]